MVSEDEILKVTKPKKRRKNDVKENSREALEGRIGHTRSGYDWVRRVNQIGKDNPIRSEESKGGEDASST